MLTPPVRVDVCVPPPAPKIVALNSRNPEGRTLAEQIEVYRVAAIATQPDHSTPPCVIAMRAEGVL